MYRVICAGLFLFISTSAPAAAIQFPVNLADAKQYGESTTTTAIIADSSYDLPAKDDRGPSASLLTPFKLAAFVYADKKATYGELKPSDLAEIKNDVSLDITARAF